MSTLTSHEELCTNFFAKYINEFGEQKLRTVHEKIMVSDKVSGLISRSRFEMKPPIAEHFLYAVPSTSYFFLKKNITVAAGCLFALLRWNDEVNVEFEMLDQHELDQIVRSIIIKFRIHL